MALTTILEEQTIAADESGEYYIEASTPLVVGETYVVAWNGTEYECEAFSFSPSEGVTFPTIGNPSVDGGDAADNGMPFAIVYATAEITGTTSQYAIMALDGSASATIAIYQEVADEETEEEQEGIILKDRNGNDVAYYDIETVTFDTTTEGKQQTYTKGVKAEKTVELSLADGDQTVEPDEGTLLSKVTIQKPETLVPENIKSGVEVGGVTGEFAGDTEEATVELALADGNQVVSPSADGKALSKVTIVKPETLVPGNIAKDVDIGGVVGTLEAGSVGGGSGVRIEYELDDEGDIINAKMYGFTKIPDYCFCGCSKLQSVDITESPGITSIGMNAFYQCSSLTNFTIPDTVTSIGTYAFYGCGITNVVIPEGVTSIANYAFAQNTATQMSVTLPSTLVSIGNNAFGGCVYLRSITIPASVTSIGYMAFYGNTYMTTVKFEVTTGWWYASSATATSGTSVSVGNTSTAATYLRATYGTKYWFRS